jgi:preprotein translocase YajC subunit
MITANGTSNRAGVIQNLWDTIRLKKGDQVVTAGGMHGRLSALDGQVLTLELTPGVNVRFNKSFIASVKS